MSAVAGPQVLITGAAGAIGSTLRRGLAGRYALLRLADVKPLEPARAGEETVTCDMTDAAATGEAMRGIECVVHLAGIPHEAPWEAILPHNIVGTYNVFEQARLAGVKRIVYASSNHVIGFYRADERVGADAQPRPDSRYGVSKVFGEALARLYADKHGMSVACLRIGSFRERPEDARQLATWVSPRDMTELVRCAIEAGPYDFLVVYGVSANARARWDNPYAARIGYVPRDNAEDYAKEVAHVAPATGDPAAMYHGGRFCALERSASRARSKA